MAAETDSPIDLARAAAFVLGPLRVHPPTLEIASGRRRESLEPRIMQVFVALERQRGEVVSREALIAQCWDGRAVGDDAINRCIGRLRRLAEAEGGFVIETVPRVGYRLKETAQPAVTPVARPLPRWRWIAAAAVAIAALTAAAFHFWPAPPLNRVAVLPLQPLGSAEDARVFGAAVTDQIVGVMSENQVQAVSRDEIGNLRGTGRDEAAEKLGADFILDGTVQHTPQGLSVIVHLDRASSHTTLWTGSFDQAGLDPVALQSQVAARVVDEIKGALSAASIKDDAAIAAYLKAKEFAREGGRTATMQRLDQMRIVVDHAPDFGLGHSGLAWSAASRIPYADDAEVPGLRDEARREAEQALKIDRHTGEAYLALAALPPPHDFGEQERLLRQGLDVEPDEPTLNSNLAALLEDVGRIADAQSLYERAAVIDPLSPRKNAGLAGVQAFAGNRAAARATLARADKRWPNNPFVWAASLALAFDGDFDRARVLIAKGHRVAPQLEPDFFLAIDAALTAIARPAPDAKAAATSAILAATAKGHLADTIAIELLVRLGEVDDAFALTEHAFFTDRPDNRYARPDSAVLLRPSTAALRRDKRFLPLAQRLGLLTYWQNHVAPDFCHTEAVAPCPALKAATKP